MTVKSSILFASRLLRPRAGRVSSARRSLFGAVFCIGLSLVPLVVVLVVSDGMIQGIVSRIIELSSYHMQVAVQPKSPAAASPAAFTELAGIVAEVSGVESVYPERQGIALAASAAGRTGASVRALPPSAFTADTPFTELLTVTDGTLALPTARSALIGSKIAETLRLKAGDTFRLITMKTGASGKTVPRMTPFKVEGVVSCGYQELDALWVFIPFETGYSLLSDESSALQIGIQTPDAFSPDMPKTARLIEQITPAGARVLLWNELNVAQYENFASTRMLLIFIMFLIVLVASVNVSSALVMLSMERRKEIAILKSIGATTGGIVTTFLLTGFCMGLAGVLVGLPVGILCAVNVNGIISVMEKFVNILARFWYIISGAAAGSGGDFVPVHLLDPAFYLEKIPVVLPFKELFCIAAGTILLSVIVSVIPSLRAGAEKPIDTLRKI